ncbi:unnamed protein product [Tilletia controversa]|uniref:Chromatin structure-remodeling complex protein RSC7 n=3 Tax=Tilletia TaxID=13289 RepID=A0A8X7MWK3_9BASI|nr:hypothetical protein CF336_g1995 [Tilletia laevis]KAE8203114.1 hypothetical protein CF328_g1829 [Tilletia controversa]KAE8264074.1 hypothetical protein A4X03_0g1214 [Tilletia caries]KAE8207219.1 hypothetical protein CF335_g1300 [Tilletia laevis]KAE8252665.1 hypothetical protein A4X06_0g2024 [Tilletia controversa]
MPSASASASGSSGTPTRRTGRAAAAAAAAALASLSASASASLIEPAFESQLPAEADENGADAANSRPRKRRITAFLGARSRAAEDLEVDTEAEQQQASSSSSSQLLVAPTLSSSLSNGIDASSSSRRRSTRAPPAASSTPATAPPTPSASTPYSPAAKRSRRGAATAAAAALANDAFLQSNITSVATSDDEEQLQQDQQQQEAASSQSQPSRRRRPQGALQAEDEEGEDAAAAVSTPPARPTIVLRVNRSRKSVAARKSAAPTAEATPEAEETQSQPEPGAEAGEEAEGEEDDAGEDTQAAEGEAEADDADEEGAEVEDGDEDAATQVDGNVRTVNVDGVVFVQKGDSLVLPSDEAGDTKVDENGRLQDGRVYKFPVFQLPNRADPEKLYVLSIDAARSAGYRDSLYFYRNNKRLNKVTLHMGEKEMLIARGRLSMQLRTRNVTATAVLNVFKTHGARVIKAGRSVTDDYYEAAARASGRREGERVRAEGGRERGTGDAEIFGGGSGPVGGGDYDAGFAFGPSNTLASIRNKRVDSNVHSFPDPSTGQPLLTIFGDAGLSPWVRIEEGPRAGQTMRRKMLSNLDIDQDNWMREAAYMVIGMNRELEDGRRERMGRVMPEGGMRSLAVEAAEAKRRRLEAEMEAAEEEEAGRLNGVVVNGNGLAGPSVSKQEDDDKGGSGSGNVRFVATAVLPQGPSSSADAESSAASGSHLGPIGVYEPLTGLIHVPSTTQPTQAQWTREGDIPRLPFTSSSSSSQRGGKVTGGYLAGSRVGSGAWGIASVSTQLVCDGRLEGEGVGFRVVKAGASEEDVGGEGL